MTLHQLTLKFGEKHTKAFIQRHKYLKCPKQTQTLFSRAGRGTVAWSWHPYIQQIFAYTWPWDTGVDDRDESPMSDPRETHRMLRE